MEIERVSRRGFLGAAAGAYGAGALAVASHASAATPDRPQKRLSFCRELPVLRPCDVVVCGGGPSGVAAALAARRAGLDVLLVEAMGQLGGMGISGLVSHWAGAAAIAASGLSAGCSAPWPKRRPGAASH